MAIESDRWIWILTGAGSRDGKSLRGNALGDF